MNYVQLIELIQQERIKRIKRIRKNLQNIRQLVNFDLKVLLSYLTIMIINILSNQFVIKLPLNRGQELLKKM